MTHSGPSRGRFLSVMLGVLCVMASLIGAGAASASVGSAASSAVSSKSVHAGFAGWSSSRIVAPAGTKATTSFVVKAKARSTVLVQRKVHGKWRTWKRIHTGASTRTAVSLAVPVASHTRVWRLKLVSSKGHAVVSAKRRVVPMSAPVAAAATTQYVRVGTSSFRLYGVDVYRPANSLVIYTSANGQVASPANQWGVEVSVVNGVATAVNDRQSSGAAATAIPSGGVLVTGHGKARDWLLSKAKVGKAMSLPAGLYTSTTSSSSGGGTTGGPSTPSPTSTAGSNTTPASPGTGTSTVTAAGTEKWKSGAAGDGVASGAFGGWRGTPVAIAGTWNDSFEAQTAQWSIQPGAEFGSWTADIDIAVGAIYSDRGETWAKAASGSYDARWTTALTALKTAWGGRTGTVHIRFAHEFNGDWVPWKVSNADAANFVAAWKRFRALQKSIMPAAKLVFCPNDGSSASLALDWRKAFPGAAYVDEMGVDSYNQYPFVSTSSAFTSKINSVDSYGAPVGIEKHRLYAASVGLPLAISEWNSNATMGDGAGFMTLFHDWVAANAGTGAGQVAYEILFNVASYGSGQFALYPNNSMPNAAAAYAASF